MLPIQFKPKIKKYIKWLMSSPFAHLEMLLLGFYNKQSEQMRMFDCILPYNIY
jgi:hypothetical protein